MRFQKKKLRIKSVKLQVKEMYVVALLKFHYMMVEIYYYLLMTRGSLNQRSTLLKISIPDQEILEILPLKEGARAIVMEGRHQGRVGEIMNIEKRYGARASEVTFKDEEGDEIFRTALEYVFVLNKDISILR